MTTPHASADPSSFTPHTRRRFLATSLTAGAAMALAPRGLLAAPATAAPQRPLRVAFIGIGNRGNDLLKTFRDTGLVEPVAFCDVDLHGAHTLESRQLFPAVPGFQDFRELFARMGSQFEAVVIATPDHSHFAIAMHAMAHGKHVYVEKPLAHTFAEVDLLIAQAAACGVVTQMGNQGHSGNNFHQFKAWAEAGIIRDVTRIDMFMNSPRRWHGWEISGFPEQPVPATLDWDLWHANKALHPFSDKLHPQTWRGWFEFGDGAFGDWGPHILDTAHRFLELGLPHTIEAEKRDGPNEFIFPQASTIRFDFGARGARPPVAVYWYDGVNNPPPLPPEMQGAKFEQKAGKFIYSRELTFLGGTHGETLRIVPEAKMRELLPQLPRVRGGFSDHFQNFVHACQGNEDARSPFVISGPLTQVFLLGVIAQRLGGKLEFDAATRRFTNSDAANALLAGTPPRRGWESYYRVSGRIG